MQEPPRHDRDALAAAGLSDGTPRLLRMKDTEGLYVLDDGGSAYDHVFSLMSTRFVAGGGFLHLAFLDSTGSPPGVLEVSATRTETLVRGQEPAFSGQVLRVVLYAAGDGAREFLELKRVREYTKIRKLPPLPAWPSLWSPEQSPPVEPAVLGWLRERSSDAVSGAGE